MLSFQLGKIDGVITSQSVLTQPNIMLTTDVIIWPFYPFGKKTEKRLLVFVCPITSGLHKMIFILYIFEGHLHSCIRGPPPRRHHHHHGFYPLPSLPTAFHVAALCHLGLSIKNVLSPESGPIKGRIPGRRADKAYLINKSFTIIVARAPCHTLPASL